jgi:four helix bundle protein
MEKPHKKLDVWQAAMKSTTVIYKLTNKFPEEEKFGLVSQMRRASISIPCNIAEGAARQGKKEFKNFQYGSGSLSELDTNWSRHPARVYKHWRSLRNSRPIIKD